MTKIKTELETAVTTLEHVCQHVSADSTLTIRHKTAIVSDIRCFAAILNRAPADVPTDVQVIRKLVNGIHPIQARISGKRLSNIKCSLAAGLRLFAGLNPWGSSSLPMSKDWDDFMAQCETDWQRYVLARFARFCTSIHVVPKDVCEGVFKRYSHFLDEQQVLKDPDKICKDVAQTWNGLVTRRKLGLPLLPVSKADVYQTIPLESFPISFQKDLEAYLAMRANPDIFSDENAGPPLAKTSVTNTTAAVRQSASALCYSGVRTSAITSLAVIVEPDAFDMILRFYINRHNGVMPPPWFGLTIAAQLVYIAEHYVKLAPDKLAILKKRKTKVMPTDDGITEKNKERLRQFDDAHNLDLLFMLPLRLMKEALKVGAPSTRTALTAMYALSIEILLHCPVRMRSLATIDIGTDLTWHGHGKEQFCSIYIPKERMKNREPFEADFGQESSKMLRNYLDRFRSILNKKSEDWLFPAEFGGHRSPSQLSQGISEVIWKGTGLIMNPHLFRHLAVEVAARSMPGQIETARLLLAHRKSETTSKYYSRQQGKRAAMIYAQQVLKMRKGR